MRDQQLLFGLALAVEELRRLVDAFAAGLLDQQPAVDELLQKLRADCVLVRTSGTFAWLSAKLSSGRVISSPLTTATVWPSALR